MNKSKINNIRTIRQKLGQTLPDIAKNTGIKKAAFSNYEHLRRLPPVYEVSYKIIQAALEQGLFLTLEDIYPPPKELKQLRAKKTLKTLKD